VDLNSTAVFQDLDVLIVDDDREQRAAMRELLEASGCTVAEASSGRQAMSYLVTGGAAPSVIVLDLRMHEMSGQEFLERLWSNSPLSSTPVIVVSATDPLRVPLSLRVARRFVKPADGKALLKAIDELLVRRRRRPAVAPV
jgi:CheY-like chemotaxis protein